MTIPNEICRFCKVKLTEMASAGRGGMLRAPSLGGILLLDQSENEVNCADDVALFGFIGTQHSQSDCLPVATTRRGGRRGAGES